MQYQPVVNVVPLPAALDPVWAAIFLAAFLAVVVATAWRPALGLAAIIAAQPFAGSHYLFTTTVTLPKVVLLALVVGLLGRGRLAALRKPAPRAILIALLAVACIDGATVAVAAHQAVAVRETLKWFEYALLFATVVVAYDADPQDALPLWTWTGVTLLVALLALLQEVIGAPSGATIAGVVVPRIAGPLEGPNQLAAYLDVSLAVLCAWYRPNRVLATAIVVGLLALALTFSRGGIVAAAVGIAAVFVVRAKARGALALPLGAGALLGAAAVGMWDALAHVRGLLPPPPSPFYAGGVGYRPELWRAAIALWRQSPLLGVGAGNYELELQQAGVFGVRTHANNWYLQALAEGGIALFAATIALVATLVLQLGRKIREAAPWQIAAFAASLALIVHQTVDYLVFYPKVAGPWWIAVALGASTIRRSLSRRS